MHAELDKVHHLGRRQGHSRRTLRREARPPPSTTFGEPPPATGLPKKEERQGRRHRQQQRHGWTATATATPIRHCGRPTTTRRTSSRSCSGAQTDDVLTKQLAALNADTTLVSITVGGNDVGYVDVLVACTLEGPLRCASEVNSAEDKVRTELPAKLDRLYGAIAIRAPHAKVVVLSYPRLYDVAAAPCPGVLDSSRSQHQRRR